MTTHTEENYLKALFALTQFKDGATANELSKHLGIKMPTVNSMMKRLAEKGLVVYESYKPIKLTHEGKVKATLIIRKHRLTEMFLVEKMGFEWDEVHAIAEQIEHIKSDLFFEKMDFLLNYPNTDPHGSPIPSAEGVMPVINNRKLSSCVVGDVVTFNAVSNSSPNFLKFLTNKKLSLGQSYTITNIEQYDGSMDIILEDSTIITLSKIVCEKILVV